MAVTFPGIQNVLGAEFSLTRGVLPSICTLWMLPQATLALPPGTLRIEDGAAAEFDNVAIDFASFRKDGSGEHQRWSVQLKDRRWKWHLGSISGEYNKRLPDGKVDESSKKTPQELAELLFDAMGETSRDVTELPEGVYPYVKWEATNPALALGRLLDKLACTVVLGLDKKARCQPLGPGAGLPNGLRTHLPAAHLPATRPSRLVAYTGPTVFQSKLSLEAVGYDADGTQKRLDDLTDKPTTGWYDEHFAIFQNLSDEDQRQRALDFNFRHYRVSGQAQGGLSVPGCAESVTKVTQYVLSERLTESGKDLDDVGLVLPAFVQGDYWPYSDEPTDTDDVRYTGAFKLLADKLLVEFPYPVVSLTTAGVLQKPTLYLTTGYHLRKEDGELVRLAPTKTLTGTGGDYLIRLPELFATIRAEYDGTQVTGTAEDQTAATEADKYLDFHERRFNAPAPQEVEYAGILPIELDGSRAQVRWSLSKGRPSRTQLCLGDEMDVYTTGARERKRREQLAYLAEAIG